MQTETITAFLRPKSVAIVGASPKGSTGGRILKNASGPTALISDVNARVNRH
jgi:acyl-CoA synthetase (NDP forming)